MVKKDKLTIGIIGGRGILGKIFSEFFRKYRYEVLISGRRTELTNIELVKKSDIVIVSVPISSTLKVIKDVLPYVREDQLLMDFTSIKELPIKLMLKSKASVIGLHPMFGKVKSIREKTIIVIPARPGKWMPEILDLFKKEKVKIKITRAERHDQIMAILQSVLHVNFIVTGKVLREASKKFNTNLKELLDYGGVVYNMRYSMIARLLAQDPELYASISIKNKKAREISEIYRKASKKISKIIKKKN